jgi:3-oxoacyl-[acyl-carrier-protein] synthase-3
MSNRAIPTILGLGFKVPDTVRDNNDAIFDYLHEKEVKKRNEDPDWPPQFVGYDKRHVLKEVESLIDIMKPAAEDALKAANVGPEQIDMLLGCASLSQYLVPSELYDLHKKLKLVEKTLAVPLGNDFSNFNVALVLADALIRAERADTILIAIGGNWTRAVDYHEFQALSAGDGAAAAVVGLRSKENLEDWQHWHVVDEKVLAVSSNFGTMYLAGDSYGRRSPWEPQNELRTGAHFHITPEGASAFWTFGRDRAPESVFSLLASHNIQPENITLIAHQASAALLGPWKERIKPGDFFETLKHYGNMTVANIPVNLALALLPEKSDERKKMNLKELVTPYIVLLALGPDMHAHALLLGNGKI